MRIGLAADHAGVHLKAAVKIFLEESGYELSDFGVFDREKPVDYPDYAKVVAEAVAGGELDYGILFNGTGVGMAIAANKVKGAYCANISDVFSARNARRHNNCNMIALGERTIGVGLAVDLVEAFLEEDFDGGRHDHRVAKILEMERNFGAEK